ncbi:MAG: carbohydrate-binding domain-containing protein [Clostridia bacterium]
MKNKKFISAFTALTVALTPIFSSAAVNVTDINISGSTATITISSDEDRNVNVFSASYEGGNFKTASKQPFNITTGENTITLDNVSTNDRVYIWDENMEPLTDVISVPQISDGIIHLLGDSIDATGVENVTVDGRVLTIEAAGSYIIEGTLADGEIVVSESLGKKDEVEITLDNVTVTNTATAPFNGANGKITIVMTDNSVNTFTYGGTKKYSGYTSTDAPKGAFYSKRDLTISGAGILSVTDNYKNALVSGSDLEVKKDASLTVTAVNNAIKGDNGVKFSKKTGTVTVYSSEGDCIKTDAVDSDTGFMEQDKGCVEIGGGTFSLTALRGDGIQAENYIEISGGTLNINSGAEGLKANEVNVPLSLDDAPLTDDDGSPILGNGKINISGGTVIIVSGEDGVKATEDITISGGNITITAEGAEGYDGIQVGETEETVTGNVTEKTIIVPGTITVSGGNINILNVSDDAITSNHNIVITEGTVSGKSSSDFLKAYNSIDISGGTFNIESTGDAIQSGNALTDTETNGTVTSTNYTLGNVNISGGDFTIKTNGGYTATLSSDADSCKGIKGVTELNISGGTFNINSADDALHSNYNLTVTGGDFTIYSGDDGLHADYILTLGTEGGSDDSHVIDVLHSYEGLEGSVIKVLSGTQYVYSTDDGLNAAGDYAEDGTQAMGLFAWNDAWGQGPGGGGFDDSSAYGMAYIKGGKTYIEAYGDGLDSNGSIEMTGGVVIVNGPTSGGNGVFDKGDSAGSYFNHMGGTLIGVGTNSMTITINSSQGVATSSSSSSGSNRPGGPGGGGGTSASGSAGVPIKITTNSGNIVIVPKVNWSYLYASTPDMTKNGSYTYQTMTSYTGGTKILGKTVNNTFYGLIENVD